jgi:pyruvate/2-oxoglutarate dehydrogenase complex dihydrolipoamide dehydrogenase (E3) component
MKYDFKQFDAIIIGAGQSGPPLAKALAGAGQQVALVERKHVGGSCINTGCTPTKTMIASARIAHLVGRAKDYGVDAAFNSVNFQKVIERKQDVVKSFREGSKKKLLETEGLTLLEGEASFTGNKELQVKFANGKTEHIKAGTIVINTGTVPNMPPIPGLGDAKPLNSASIMELNELPRHLLIIGGGYIGVEFGQMFRRFGSEVTIIQRDKQLLSMEDSDVAEEVAKILKNEGLEIILNADTKEVEKPEPDKIILTVEAGGKSQKFEGSHLLVAAGRVPDTEILNLESTGVKTDDRGFISVNVQLETAVPGIFATGDVKGGPAFTHISYDDFRILKKNLLEDGNATTTGRPLPYVVFIDPQLGRIGLTEKAAKEIGHKCLVAKMPASWVARAIEIDETDGLLKVIVDNSTGQILGAAVLCVEGGEVMALLQVAMMAGMHYTTLRDAIFSHPTISEAMNTLFGMIES